MPDDLVPNQLRNRKTRKTRTDMFLAEVSCFGFCITAMEILTQSIPFLWLSTPPRPDHSVAEIPIQWLDLVVAGTTQRLKMNDNHQHPAKSKIGHNFKHKIKLAFCQNRNSTKQRNQRSNPTYTLFKLYETIKSKANSFPNCVQANTDLNKSKVQYLDGKLLQKFRCLH